MDSLQTSLSVSKVNKILAVKTHALGDVLMVTPAIRALRNSFPEAEIDFLTGSWSAGAVKYNPDISNIIEVADAVFHDKKIKHLYGIIRMISKKRYDLATVFQPSPAIQLLVRLAGVKHIAAPVTRKINLFVSNPSTWRQNRARYVVEDFLDVVRTLGIKTVGADITLRCSASAENDVQELCRQYQLKRKRFLLVFPGGGRNPRDYVPQKIWPQDRFKTVLEWAESNSIPVVLAGGNGDTEVAEAIASNNSVVNLTGKTSLDQVIALIKQAAVVLTNDSAPVHMALSQHTGLVAIFGPSRRAALLPCTGKFISVEADIPCAPCYDNEPFGECQRRDCILSISVDRVIKALEKGWEQWSR